ncbi:MAG: STAS domain-containing protein [Colwellia sp.]|nr:STAS domain-containing protein [Colwellia sp.]
MSTITLTLNNDTAELAGELTRHTVPSLSEHDSRNFLKQKNAKIDLAAVNKIDTAGLAWLLSQVEFAQANSCQLSFVHLPSGLIKLAELSSVDSFLPINLSS